MAEDLDSSLIRFDPAGIERSFKSLRRSAFDSSVDEEIDFLRRQMFLLACRYEKRSRHGFEYAAVQQFIEKELDRQCSKKP